MPLGNTEWDWPPPRRRGPVIDGRIERESVVFVSPRGDRQASGRRQPTIGDKVADVFFRSIVLLYRVAFGAALGLVVVGCVWLMVAVIRA